MAIAPLMLILSSSLLTACGDKEGDTAESVNRTPIASAGADVASEGLNRVALVGTASYDPDGDPITYHWSFDRVPSASSLNSSTTAFALNDSGDAAGTTFVPDAIGVYVISLVVKDNQGASSTPDYLVVDISGGSAPVAVAGTDITGSIGSSVTLDGSSSYDPLGLTLSYSWSLASVPTGSAVTTLVDSSSVAPSFSPDVGGVYVAALQVHNGFLLSGTDTTFVYVSSGDPSPPTALTQGDISDAQDCLDMSLDGSASFDPNGDPLSYNWTLQSKPDGSATDNYSFGDRRAEMTTFFPDISGTYGFSLAVSDGTSWSAPETFTAVVKERFANTPPRIDIGPSIEVSGGTALCTEGDYGTWECGSCSAVTTTIGGATVVEDSEDTDITLLWTVSEGDGTITGSDSTLSTTVSLRGAVATEPEVCTPNFYRFQLAATDCPQETGAEIATVIVQCCGELYSPDTGD